MPRLSPEAEFLSEAGLPEIGTILPQMGGAGKRLTGNIVVVSVRVRPIDNKEGQPGEHREEKE